VSWWPRFVERFRRYMLLKFFGTTAFIWIFFIGYFHVLHNPAYEVAVMPVTALDQAIGFHPWALVLYGSLWFYVGIPPAMFHGLRELVAYGCWIGALCIAGLAIFHFWPTAVPSQAIDPGIFPGFGIIQGLDAAGNACPSLHVATAAFSAVWLDRLLREIAAGNAMRLINWAWFALIAWSTVAIRQHVVIDVVTGLALGVAFALPSLRLRPAG
jgi:membrane-associated phospholipid phosphatase